MSDNIIEDFKVAVKSEDYIAMLLNDGPQTDRAKDLGKDFGNS